MACEKLTILLPAHRKAKLAIDRRIQGITQRVQVVTILEKALADNPKRLIMALLDQAPASPLLGSCELADQRTCPT